MMTKLWLYAYATGQRSSRKLAQLAIRDVGCMMLAAGNRPDFRTLNSFRLRHLAALEGCSGRCWRCAGRRAWCGWTMWPFLRGAKLAPGRSPNWH